MRPPYWQARLRAHLRGRLPHHRGPAVQRLAQRSRFGLDPLIRSRSSCRPSLADRNRNQWWQN
jgi:hypothetical protein